MAYERTEYIIKIFKKASLIYVVALISLCFISPMSASATIKGYYLYSLADLTGILPLKAVPVSFDEKTNETYVVDMRSGSVRVFNDKGMEIFKFGNDPKLGRMIYAAAALNDGDIMLMSYFDDSSLPSLVLCNYRGVQKSRVLISGLPDDWSGFHPTRMIYQNEKAYLADLLSMRVALVDLRGHVIDIYDIESALSFDKAKTGLSGFSVDDSGRLLFTINVIFSAFRMDSEGQIESFGVPGDTVGKFGVVSGIASDEEGHIFVADKLRCVILVFDKNLNFVFEFGYRSDHPAGLIAPDSIVMGSNGKMIVTRQGEYGIGVFQFEDDNPH